MTSTVACRPSLWEGYIIRGNWYSWVLGESLGKGRQKVWTRGREGSCQRACGRIFRGQRGTGEPDTGSQMVDKESKDL